MRFHSGSASIAILASATISPLSVLGFEIRDSVKNACDQLRSAYPDALLMHNSTAYEEERINFWDKRSNLDPACIFLPGTADAVADGVAIFHKEKAQFAVRGGGHMNYPGSNSVDGGVLVGLNGLTDIKVNTNQSRIEVGPGNKWVDVYEALAPSGHYTIGGRLKTIGVPGLSLIGGVGYFLNKYGFTMDNVLSYDVVLGGGSNFGIVTKFVFKTYHIPQVSSTYQIFDDSQAHDFIRAACSILLSEDGAVGAGAVININYNVTTMKATPSSLPAVSRRNAVMRPVDWHSQMVTPNQMFRVQFGHHTMEPDADQLIYIYDQWKASIEEVAEIPRIWPTFILNFAPKSGAAVAKRNGVGNTFGLDDKQSYIWWQFTTSWANEEDDLRVTAWHQHHLKRLHEMNKQKGLASDFLYMGDSGEWQDSISTYGDRNIQKMRKIRDLYDPDLTFTKLNWGGFKLGY
ncbi:hypothetical protein V2G26_010172 [Clonostachys chloroleuca]